MEFASEYVLEEEEEEEEIDDTDSEGDFQFQSEVMDTSNNEVCFECEIMMESDEEEETAQMNKEMKKGRSKEINLNTVKLNLSCIKEPTVGCFSASQLVKCPQCQAVLSHIDKKFEQDGKLIWRCRFCSTENVVNPEQWPEFPKDENKEPQNDALYFENIQFPLPSFDVKKEDSKIIFVVDISASMQSTIQVNRKDMSLHLQEIVQAENNLTRYQMLAFMDQNLRQLMNVEDNSPVLEVSRLNAVKAAVRDPLKKIGKENPTKRLGLITFCDVVSIYGDQTTPILVKDSDLDNKDLIYQKGEERKELGPARDSYKNIIHKIKSIAAQGQTALGPALVAAIGMCSDCPGSKIILCTDGMANIGLGKIERATDKEIGEFYSPIITECQEKGISVSLICFDNCGIKTTLGSLVTETAGYLDKIKPDTFANKFAEEMTREIMATDTKIEFVVPTNMFVHEAGHLNCNKESRAVKLVGNIDDNITKIFQFGIKSPTTPQATNDENNAQEIDKKSDVSGETSKKNDGNSVKNDEKSGDIYENSGKNKETGTNQANNRDENCIHHENAAFFEDKSVKPQPKPVAEEPSSEVENVTDYPIQVQVTCKNMEGKEVTRVWTNLKKVTRNRDLAEKAANADVTVLNQMIKHSGEILDSTQNISLRDRAKTIVAAAENLENTFKDQLLGETKDKLKQFIEVMIKIQSKSVISDDNATFLRNLTK